MTTEEMISVFSDNIEKRLPSLKRNGYTLLSAVTSHADNPDHVFHRVIYQNTAIDRAVYFDFAPQSDDITLDVFIWSEDDRVSSLTIMDFIEYEKTNEMLPYSCCFGMAPETFETDLNEHLDMIENLFSHDLKYVIAGEIMIHIPIKDPRK